MASPGRLDIVALLDIGEQPSSSAWAIAAQIEATLPHVFVHVSSVTLRSPQSSGALERTMETILELSPNLVAAGCNVWNVTSVLELCERVHRLAPRIPIALGGQEAEAREAELLAGGYVSQVIRGDAAPGLVAALQTAPRRGRDKERRSATSTPRLVTPIQLYQRRVGDLAQVGRASGRRLLVEADWGHRLPLHLARHVGMSTRGLSVEGAIRRLQPLLRAGVPVRLTDPALSLDRDRLMVMLGQLEGGSLGQLELELPVEHLDEALLAGLGPAGVCALELDLDSLGNGRADPDRLHAIVLDLSDRQIACRGSLVFGLPSQDHSHVRRTVDAAVQIGLDDLHLERLLIPPGSVMQRKAARLGLQHAPHAPYEVLAHASAPHQDMVRSLRLAATLELLRESLPGTGLLRVLGGELGSAAEILDGFAESLAVNGQDPLESDPAESAERAFLDHLRRVHGVDLNLVNGRIRLARSPLLAVRWTGDGRRLITDDSTGRVAQVGRHALALLDRFDEPRSAHQVCEQVMAEVAPSRRGRLRREVQRTLEKLVSMSFLVPAPAGGQHLEEDDEFPFTCLEEFDYHYRMLSDSVRVRAYRRAIAMAVSAGQHVIEIGTGTGILAVLAAKAGARVTAIERFSVLGIARSVARQSGVDEKIDFIRGRSDLVRVEEPGDLLISEIVGNRILNEGILETTLDARRRLLKPNARLIPEKIEILAEVGCTERFDHLRREFSRVGDAVGVNLEPLATWFQGRVAAGQVVWELGTEGEDFVPLAEEVSLVEIDLRSMEAAEFSVSRPVLPRQDGLANAVVLAFRLQLQPGIELSTRGRHHGLHWSKPVFMLRQPLQLRRGQAVHVRAVYEAHGDLLVSLEPG